MLEQRTDTMLPFAFVSKAEVNTRVTNYQNGKHVLLSTDLGKPDTKSIWYSILHLQQLMDELKLQEASGMRIYFGAYPATHEFAGQLCLLMVPTRANGETLSHEDIIIEEQANFAPRFADFDPLAIEDMYKSFNFGSPCPPACRTLDQAFPY